MAAFRNSWLHTGDIGTVDEAGNVFFLGRKEDIIRRRGESVNAVEVEEQFLRHPDVVVAAAYAIPSSPGIETEEEVKVVIQTTPRSTITERALWEWAVKHMARLQVPSVIRIVNTIPCTTTGKLEKHNLTTKGGSKFDIRTMLLGARL